ncbi:FxLYD domain-containing protein [Streptomyces sp. NPDC026673]|uniref:FxLYD domain-containing protein n=1 Tax=Streptomyces sp. NPDC026673 TaxID=3155724 RepID=UPI0033EE101F
MSTPQYPPPPGPPAGPPQPPPGWQQPGWQQPGWAGPPPQPRKSNVGKIIGFGCLGVFVLAVLVVFSGVVGVLVGNGGGSDPKPGASKDSGRPPTAPSKSKGSGDDKEQEEAGPTGDVKIDACTVDDLIKWPSAELTITNRSSKTSNYVVQVEFVDSSGTRISEGLAATNNLEPGRKAKETAQGLKKATGKITCRVTEVTRYAS